MVSTVASWEEGYRFKPSSQFKSFCVELECVLKVPPTVQIHAVILNGTSESLVGVNVNINGCLSLCVSPVID